MRHHSTNPFRVGRRQLFGAAIALPIVGSAALSGCARSTSSDPGQVWRDFLADVAVLLIPVTDTPGGDDVYVWAQDIALNAIYVGMDDASYAMLGLIQDALNAACDGAYLKASHANRFTALHRLDAASYANPLPQTDLAVAWRKIKGLLLLGYYTSEAGASKELRYELVPGRYDPDVPVTPDTRAISSDWFAVSFR